jgi:hypothetical protein
LHGNPITVKSSEPKRSWSAWSCSYCGVKSALGGDVDEERDLAALIVEQVGPTVEGRDGECVDAHRTGLLMG